MAKMGVHKLRTGNISQIKIIIQKENITDKILIVHQLIIWQI